MSYFSDFASVYDEFTGNVSYPERAAYINRLLKNNGITGGILLDLACGTGSLLACLLERGYDAMGADLSEDMLAVASEKLCDQPKLPLLICCPMQELELPEKRIYATVAKVECWCSIK